MEGCGFAGGVGVQDVFVVFSLGFAGCSSSV